MHLQENYEMEEFYFSLPHYSIIHHLYLGWHTYDVLFEERRGKEGGGVWQKWDVIGRRGCGVSECSGRLKRKLDLRHDQTSCWAKHYWQEILWTRNLHFDSDVRQWTSPLLTPLHCLWDQSNNRTGGQFNVTWIGFVFTWISFIHIHGAVVVPQFVCVFKLCR